MPPSVAKGERVRISEGVFLGVEGTVVALRGENRLIIHVELLQQGVTIEVDVTAVQSLEPRPRFRFSDRR